MAIRRQRLNRKVDLVLDGDRVVDLSPGWAFTIECPHHGALPMDFGPLREHGRERLAEQIRDAFWSMRHEIVGATLRGYYTYVSRLFRRFLDDLHAAGEIIDHVGAIDRRLLDRYLAWLELQVNTKEGVDQGRPLSLSTKKNAYGAIKSVLMNRMSRTPDEMHPELSFPKNPFPNYNRRTPKREAYSPSEQKRILEALNVDLRTIHEEGWDKLSGPQVLLVHLVVLGMATGRNLQSLLDMRRDSVRPHPLADRELLVTTKRRGWSTHAMSVRKGEVSKAESRHLRSIPASVGDHFRSLCDHTASLMPEARLEDREFAFLLRLGATAKRPGQVIHLNAATANGAIPTFIKRHGLCDDGGQPLVLSLARLRPTFAQDLYRRTKDIRRVQQALGHSNVETTARHYVDAPLESDRDHAIALDGMVSHYTRIEIDGKVFVAADGGIPLDQVKDLLSNGYSTGIARCKNPFREGESVCQKFFACFKCPSMCVFEDDLWRLFSFYYRLLAERTKINAAQWVKTYGPIIRRIDTDIAAQFPLEKVETAKQRAQCDPHPTWRGFRL